MKLDNVTLEIPEIDDKDIFRILPEELKIFYSKSNVLIALNGGIQFRGCVKEPKWISLYEIWKGKSNLHSVYDSVFENDIPFAQDAFGDHYIYKSNGIYRLYSETGELENLNCSLNEFINHIETDPIDYLSLQQITQLKEQGIILNNGEMMNVFPPFLFESEKDRSYKPVPIDEQMKFLKEVYLQTNNMKEGQKVKIKIKIE